MTITSDENVFGLEVTIDDTSGMQTLHTLDNFSSIETSSVAAQATPARQLGSKIATRMEILKLLSEILSTFGFSFNSP